MKINVLLTFDYELPLGGIAESFSRSLFEPTEDLFKLAQTEGVPVVLFSDSLSYLRFKEKGITEYQQGFENQMKYAVKNGHDVQPHLHPHWLETEIAGTTFIPSSKFRLADFVNNRHPDNIAGIVEKGCKTIEDICKSVDANYKCVAYRGGGFNIAPYSKEIFTALIANGIRFDSSIVHGYFFVSDQNLVDFRKVVNKPNWHLSEDGSLNKTGNNGIWEIPVAGIPKRVFELPTKFKLKKYAGRAPEGRGKMCHSSNDISIRNKLAMLLSSRMLTVDNYTYSPEYVCKIFDYHVKRFRAYEEISVALIGHPKSMGAYSFELLRRFIQHVRNNYGKQAEFTTFSELSLSLPKG